MVILDPSIDERVVQQQLAKYLDVITADGGTIDNLDIWGRRRLAYEIDKQTEGIYVVLNATCTPETVKEFDRQLGLNESVIRSKVIKPTVSAAAPSEA